MTRVLEEFQYEMTIYNEILFAWIFFNPLRSLKCKELWTEQNKPRDGEALSHLKLEMKLTFLFEGRRTNLRI